MEIKLKVFLSGGFKSNWQSTIINECKDDFVFFNPKGHNIKEPQLYTTWDVHFVKECDILFAYMEETNPSGYGLTFEIGIAYALNKTIILIDEKSKENEEFCRNFQMILNSANVVFNSLDEGIRFLKHFANHL
jgi:nucleoside 2-deoxyribosyltransferase